MRAKAILGEALAFLPALAAAVLVALASAPAAAAVLDAGAVAQAQSDQLIVRYRSAAGAAVLPRVVRQRTEAVLRRHEVRLLQARPLADGSFVLKLDRRLPAAQLERIGEALRAADADVEYVEPDVMLQPQGLSPPSAEGPR
ncbi:hypothetical protein [Azohydromonas australica]|uniref:hypothetical protein n=1 Tax=Azohydromonas australica TaxID=364039 RepID=UPI000427C6DD|nr:hypothetical protein [Azohydromonas australica]